LQLPCSLRRPFGGRLPWSPRKTASPSVFREKNSPCVFVTMTLRNKGEICPRQPQLRGGLCSCVQATRQGATRSAGGTDCSPHAHRWNRNDRSGTFESLDIARCRRSNATLAASRYVPHRLSYRANVTRAQVAGGSHHFLSTTPHELVMSVNVSQVPRPVVSVPRPRPSHHHSLIKR
jgi:hypothetical protein